jgi:excinuclease ABC subunit B
VETLDRVEIMDQLRDGTFDVLIGINLLREGLDLPEVALVAILDADKEGFLRSSRSLTQTSGRAARNIDGKVIMYADKITRSMQQTIDETTKRREKQLAYNEKNGITPQQIIKAFGSTMGKNFQNKGQKGKIYSEPDGLDIAADPIVKYMDKMALEKAIEKTKLLMEKAAKDLDFKEAARLRDEMFALQELLKKK